MANTRKVLLSLHIEVADRLDQEPNKSAVVDALAAAHYGLNFEGGGAASFNRQALLDKIKAASTETVTQPEPEPMAAPVEVDEVHVMLTTTIVPELEAVELPSDVNIMVAPPGGEIQPVAAFVPVAPESGFVPQVQPLEAVTPEIPAEVAPPVESAQPLVEPIISEPVIEPLPTPPSLVEAVAAATVDPLPEIPIPVSVQVEPGTVLDPNGQQICPVCKEAMITPVCLNCL